MYDLLIRDGQVVVDAGGYHGAMAGRVVRRGDAGARPRTRVA